MPRWPGDLREVGGAGAFFGQAGDGVRDFLAGQRAVEDTTADGMDQGAGRCLARRDVPPPQRVRPAAQPGQDLLRPGQVSGLVADLPEAPVAETRAAFAMPGAITAA